MAGIAEDEIVEHTLTQIQECYLFHLPPRVRAQGWLAADMTKQMWTGRMRVVQRGMEAAVMLIDRRDGKLFAMCKVEDGAVERVPDSSRYFVIKIQNAQGRHAFVGLAFDDRNQAFDFNVALQEFKKDVERSKMLEKGEEAHSSENRSSSAPSPASNLSLKQGEKIKISIGGGKLSSRPKRSGGGGGGFTLAPPPGDTARKSGFGGLLARPRGDTRRARGIAPPSKPASSVAAVALAPAPSSSSPPPSSTNSSASRPISGSATSGFSSSPRPAVAPLSSSSAPPDPFGGRNDISPTPGGGSNTDPFGGGLAGGFGVISGGVPSSSRGAQSNINNADDDPLGLGLGFGSSRTTSPPPAPAVGAGWGLSDLSGLGVGLPAVKADGGVGGGARHGSPGMMQPAAGGFVGSGGMQQPPQQQQRVGLDPFSQGGGSGWATSNTASTTSGSKPQGTGFSSGGGGGGDDVLGGLF